MASVGWGPHENGQVPLDQLMEIPDEPGKFNHASAVLAFVAMRLACFVATGYWITVTEGYRNLDGQWDVWYRFLAGGPVAAVPGNSNHGRAIAFDIGGYNQPGVWAWLTANAAHFGFSWATGKASNEDWHWEYIGALGIASNGSEPFETEEGLFMKFFIFEGIGVVLSILPTIWLNPDPSDKRLRAEHGAPRLVTDSPAEISRTMQEFGIPGDYSVFVEEKKKLLAANPPGTSGNAIPIRRF